MKYFKARDIVVQWWKCGVNVVHKFRTRNNEGARPNTYNGSNCYW